MEISGKLLRRRKMYLSRSQNVGQRPQNDLKTGESIKQKSKFTEITGDFTGKFQEHVLSEEITQ